MQIMITMACLYAGGHWNRHRLRKKGKQKHRRIFSGRTDAGTLGHRHERRGLGYVGLLLMGLPGVAYWSGLADASWTAIGLAIGTYVNWLITSKRLRRYSEKAGNAITLPEFFSNRFHEKNKVVMTISALFILVFFTVYAASCLVTCGKLFSTLFGFDYVPMMIVGAVFVLVYTIIGGFLAESASDFMQAVVMISALVIILFTGTAAAGGLDAVLANAGPSPASWSSSAPPPR